MTSKQRQILKKCGAYVKKAMSGEGSGHDWWHVARVHANACLIAKGEPKADLFVLQTAALLHDIKDWKFAKGDEEAGPKEAGRLLKRLGAQPAEITRISSIMREVTYKGAGVKTRPSTLEGKIVQDADRLDAMGAIGIARCFAYGGMRGREIYNPEERPVLHQSFAQYKKSKGHSINHFYEKLLLLKNRMNTKTGRKLAKARDQFMRSYLKNFYSEWKGKIMSLLIRPAIQSDVNVICDMIDAKRQQYAKWQPVFHNPAEDAKEKQKPYILNSLHVPETIILVADDRGFITGCVYGRLVDAPPVYNPGGKVLLVDDFVLADQAAWSTVGKQLLNAVWERAQSQGAVLLNVICGPKDEPKRALMQEFEMSVATEWWVKPK